MPPKRKKKAKTPKTQSQRQSVTVNINTTKRSKSRRRSALPASYPPQMAPTFVTSNQDFDRISPLLAGILQSQQQMFRDISVPTQPMIKAEEPTPTSNFQKPNSLEGFGAPPPLQSSASAKSTGSVQSSVMGSPKDFDNVENDFVSTSLPQKKAPLARSKLDEPLPDLKPIPEPVQPSKKSMIPDKSFVSKTYNPRHQEILKTEPRSESLNRATEEGEETIGLLQSLLGTQSRPQEIDAPPNVRPLTPPTRERSLSNMLNIAETPPPNIPEPIRERSPSPEPIPKKVPEDRLSISEKKMIKRQKAEEEAKERAVMEIPEDIFPKKDEKAKERARAAIAERARAAIPERARAAIPERKNVLKTEELDTRTSRASMEEVIEESKKRQKIPDEDLLKIAKQGRIISSVLPPKPPEAVITEPVPEKEPAYFIDIEPTMELDFRGKEIQETKQKREQPTKVRPRPIAPDSLRPMGTSLDSVLPRGTSLDSILSSGNLIRTPSTLQNIREVSSPSPRPKPIVPKRKPKTRFISESSLSLDEPERIPTLSPIPSNTTRPRGTSLDSVLPLRPRGTSLDSILSSGNLIRTPSTLQSIREEPSARTRRGKKSPISDSPKFV